MKRYTIAVDFDGVLHNYSGDFKASHVIEGKPIDGAIEWLFTTIQKMDVVIFSCRCRTWIGRRAIRAWLKKYADGIYHEHPGCIGIESVKIQHKKPAALVYLDDRAMRFEGIFPTLNQIHQAKPWNHI